MFTRYTYCICNQQMNIWHLVYVNSKCSYKSTFNIEINTSVTSAIYPDYLYRPFNNIYSTIIINEN